LKRAGLSGYNQHRVIGSDWYLNRKWTTNNSLLSVSDRNKKYGPFCMVRFCTRCDWFKLKKFYLSKVRFDSKTSNWQWSLLNLKRISVTWKKQPEIIHDTCIITTDFSTLNQGRILNSSEPGEKSWMWKYSYLFSDIWTILYGTYYRWNLACEWIVTVNDVEIAANLVPSQKLWRCSIHRHNDDEQSN